jgi:uncharacterized protein (DUF849 family)
VKPEVEVFDLGHIELAKRLIADGYIAEPPMFQLCLGIPWGAPQPRDHGPRCATGCLRTRCGRRSAFPARSSRWPLLRQASGAMSGSGSRTTCTCRAGQLAPSNAALVEKAVTLLELLDFTVAKPAEARQIFGLRGA